MTGQTTTTDAAVAAATVRKDAYAQVTDTILAELEAGRFPWAQPWDLSRLGALTPMNARTGAAYRGVNILLLWIAAHAQGFDQGAWLTFHQAKDLGGSVRKGSKGAKIVVVKDWTPKESRAKTQGAETDEAERRRFLKTYTVFNLDQIDGLEHLRADPAQIVEAETLAQAERVIAATGADLRRDGVEACYRPGPDMVVMPPHQAFKPQLAWYPVAFHELGHWTGHKSRLDRDLAGSFGSRRYAFEEMIAEWTAAFVCARLAIAPAVRHADYIGHWLDLLKADSRAAIRAAAQAQRAADFILDASLAREAA